MAKIILAMETRNASAALASGASNNLSPLGETRAFSKSNSSGRLERGGYFQSVDSIDESSTQDQNTQTRRLPRASRPRQGVFSVKDTFDRIMGTAATINATNGADACTTCGQDVDPSEEREIGEQDKDRTCIRCRRHEALFDQKWPERRSPLMQMAVEKSMKLIERLRVVPHLSASDLRLEGISPESTDNNETPAGGMPSGNITAVEAVHSQGPLSLFELPAASLMVSAPLYSVAKTRPVEGIGEVPVTMTVFAESGLAPVLMDRADLDERTEVLVSLPMEPPQKSMQRSGKPVWADRRQLILVKSDSGINWSAAITVPSYERDSTMPDAPVVARSLVLNDGCFEFQQLHPPHDVFVQFSDTSEPFVALSTDPNFFQVPGIHEALVYLQTGKVPEGFKWAMWGDEVEVTSRGQKSKDANGEKEHLERLASEALWPFQSPHYRSIGVGSTMEELNESGVIRADPELASVAERECGLNVSLFTHEGIAANLPVRRNQPVFVSYGGRWKRCMIEDAFLVPSSRFGEGKKGSELALKVLAVGEIPLGKKRDAQIGLYREIVRVKQVRVDIPWVS
ncbi:hypothetical protein HDU93_001500 [Gonapodya sp. JEL0774]|nr:hypothetical protein HDU93_001500 [Gonapodya sp. JEL0774]